MGGVIGSILGGPLIDGIAKVISILKGKNSPEAIAAAQQLETLQAQWSSEFQMAQLQQVTAQIDVNKTEATNQSTFVAGWRPGIGWICGFAMAYAFILQPFIVTAIQVVQCVHSHTAFTKDMLPIVDMSQMWPVLLGLLGLGAMRSWDKQSGTSNGH